MASTEDAKAGEEAETKNTWQEALKRASTRTKDHYAHLVIVGSPESGKSSVVNLFNKKLDVPKKGNPMLLEYAFSTIGGKDADDPVGDLNIWQVANSNQVDCLAAVLPKNELDRVVYMVVVDLSKPYRILEELEQWTSFIEKAQEKITESVTKSEKERLQDRISRYLQFYKPYGEEEVKADDAGTGGDGDEKKGGDDLDGDGDGMLDDDEDGVALEEIKLDKSQPPKNVAAPIIFVGTKSDLFGKSFNTEADADDKYDIMTGFIRKHALQFGGSTFSLGGQKKKEVQYIREYIEHRVFNTDSFDLEPSPSVSYSSLGDEYLFVPAGFDAEAMVTLALGKHTAESFPELFPPPKKASQARRQKAQKLTADKDQNFLKYMQTLILKDPPKHSNSRPNRPPGQRPFNPRDPRGQGRANLPPGLINISKTGPRPRPGGGRSGGAQNREKAGEFFKKLLAGNAGGPSSSGQGRRAAPRGMPGPRR